MIKLTMKVEYNNIDQKATGIFQTGCVICYYSTNWMLVENWNIIRYEKKLA